jgi:hypothetical protein
MRTALTSARKARTREGCTAAASGDAEQSSPGRADIEEQMDAEARCGSRMLNIFDDQSTLFPAAMALCRRD